MNEKMVRIRVKNLSENIMIMWFEFTNHISAETFLECGTYVDHKLVACVRFPYSVTLEEVNIFLENSSARQKVPGYHRCPAYEVLDG